MTAYYLRQEPEHDSRHMGDQWVTN